ncbi:MAG: VOC family protein [Gammaproteobacteria bacterium]|nr:VOC family protein [Gammaproteobacteria bacterium]
MTARSIPEGFYSVTPYLSIKGAKAALEFYKNAFGAVEAFRLETPAGEIGHADIVIGNSHIMLSEPCEDSAMPSPDALGGSTIGIYLYVEDVDASFSRAIKAGAEIVTPVDDQFYGDRMGTLRDPFGHVWFLATHQEDLSRAEIESRAAAMFGAEGA